VYHDFKNWTVDYADAGVIGERTPIFKGVAVPPHEDTPLRCPTTQSFAELEGN
jgi:hypothetical protein